MRVCVDGNEGREYGLPYISQLECVDVYNIMRFVVESLVRP